MRLSSSFWALLFVVLCFCGFCASTLDRSRGNSQRNKLIVSLNSEGSEVNMTSYRLEDSDAFYDGRSVRLSYSSVTFPCFSVKRYNRFRDAVSGLVFRFGFLSLIEYKETNLGQPGLDEKDQIIETFSLGGRPLQTWRPVRMNHAITDDIEFYLFASETVQFGIPPLNNPDIGVEPLVRLHIGLADLRGWVGNLNSTLAPNSLSVLFSVRGYHFRDPASKLAIKAFIEVPSLPDVRDSIPEDERDDPFLDQSDILFDPSSEQLKNLAKEDTTDTGYLSWDRVSHLVQPTLSGSNTVTNLTVHRNIIHELQDFRPESLESMHNLNAQRLHNSTRIFLFYSFDQVNPYHVQWMSFIGLDEDDSLITEEVTEGAAFSTHASLLCSIFLISLLLFVFN